MSVKRILFSDDQIVEFCVATCDTNEIHDPVYMNTLGRRVIVPGMYALSHATNLSSGFLKHRARSLKVLFNSLLNSGDFVTVGAVCPVDTPDEVRLSAAVHKDTLASKDEYTMLSGQESGIREEFEGILHRMTVTENQVMKFGELIGGTDPDVIHFLFAVAFTSRALLHSIDHPGTPTEHEISRLISRESGVSPFYQKIEISIPSPFPLFDPEGSLDYYIHFEVEKPGKLYSAFVRCESRGTVVFRSQYKLVGVPDAIILRMAKKIRGQKPGIPPNVPA